MKRIRILLSAAAGMLAVAGVYASSMVVTTYWLPNYANRAILACDVQTYDHCPTNGINDCRVWVEYFDSEGASLGLFVVLQGEIPVTSCVKSTRE